MGVVCHGRVLGATNRLETQHIAVQQIVPHICRADGGEAGTGSEKNHDRLCGLLGSAHMSARGLFIALEGIDGSGTTSQARALTAELSARGYEVVSTCEPTRNRIGRMIRDALANEQLNPTSLALMFAADRLDHIARDIEPALARNAVVVCDRYLMSSLVYQTLDCELSWVRTINRHARRPDLYLCVELPVEVAFARVKQRSDSGATVRERFDVPALQRAIAAAYRERRCDPDVADIVRVVNGDQTPQAVTAELLAAIEPHLPAN